MDNIQKFFQNKKVLITGHTGFKGGWLTKILLNFGANIIGIALVPNTNPNLFSILNIKKDIKNYFCDIRNFGGIKKIILKEKPEIVFHLAAQPLVRDSYDDPLYTFETNIIGTANLLQAIKEIGGVKSAVIITTDKVYENKKDIVYRENDKLMGYDPYSSSKVGAEIVTDSYIKSFFNPKDYNKKHKTLIASARSGNVVGGGDWQKDRIISDIVRAVFERKEKLIIRNPNSIRPWQYVLEDLYGYLLLARRLYEGKKFFSTAWNFGPNINEKCLTVQELVKKSFEILQKGSYIIKRDSTKHEASIIRLNIDKAKKFLKWQPNINIFQTLKLTFDWYKNFYEKKDIIAFTNKQIESFFKKI
jgi:CDP-glucose 4,6-dehydratase